MTKYKIIPNDTMQVGGKTLYRIQLTEDHPTWGKAGTLGGYIEEAKNLTGDAWVSDNARVFDNACVSGDAWVFGDAWVSGNARVFDNACVYGDARVSDNARVFDNARVYGDARVSDNAHVYSDAWVSGNARVSGDSYIRRFPAQTLPE